MLRRIAVRGSILAAGTFALAVMPAHAQTSYPPCDPTVAPALTISAPATVAVGRNITVRFSYNPAVPARAGTGSAEVVAADPQRPITHPYREPNMFFNEDEGLPLRFASGRSLSSRMRHFRCEFSEQRPPCRRAC
jgi:hypothetical protein